MLNSKYRLKNTVQFREIYTKGKSLAGRFMVIYYYKLAEKEIVAVGFSVSKKVGNAVVRNKYKRKLKACIMEYLPKINGYNIVVIARVRITTATYHQLEKEMKHLIYKSKII